MNNRASFTLLLAVTLTACVKVGEPQMRGRYYIDNRLDSALYAEATGSFGGSATFTDSIPAHTTSLFMEVTEGSGGHVLPSNFLSTLVLSADSLGTLVEIYSGVRNTDWEVLGSTPSRMDLVLVID